MIYTTQILVRYIDCDMYGHVNHAVYLSYLEHARTELLKEMGKPLIRFLEEGFRLFIVHVSIDYLKSAELDDILTVETSISKIGKIGGNFFHNIKRGEEILVTAEVKWVCVNDKGRPARVPPPLNQVVPVNIR